jgi:hypothetical protein
MVVQINGRSIALFNVNGVFMRWILAHTGGGPLAKALWINQLTFQCRGTWSSLTNGFRLSTRWPGRKFRIWSRAMRP